jgi:hypothetical protein
VIVDPTEAVARLTADFPSFAFWSEITADDRIRYGARRRHDGINPHTVLTTDIAELRAALSPGPARPA